MCKETSHQGSKCCSTTPCLPTEKQLTEKSARLAEAELAETDHSQLANTMARCYGYATELLVTLEAVLSLEEAIKQDQQLCKAGLCSVESLAGKLRDYLKARNRIYQIAMESHQLLWQGAGLAGQKQSNVSQCQCARMKGKSLG